MDKNLALFMDDRAFTIEVKFCDNSKLVTPRTYLYAYNKQDLKVGDLVIVPVSSDGSTIYKVVVVDSIHDTVQVPPNYEYAIRRIVGKLDLTEYNAQKERDMKIESFVAEAYKRKMRQSLREQVMGQLLDTEAETLRQLLGQ